MEVNGNTKLDDLLTEYPFLQEFLVKRSPVFKKLENAVLRKTIGKVATLTQVATKAGIEPDALVGDIAAEIAAQRGKAAAGGVGE
jgi:uncharacterized protein